VILYPGDIVLTRSQRLIPRLIRWATRETGEPPTLVNHVAMVSVGGPAIGARIIQAVFGGVEECGFVEAFGPGPWPDIAIYRLRSTPGRDLIRAVEAARAEIGDGYSVVSIALLGLDALFGHIIRRRVTLLSRLGRVTPLWFCSELIARVYRKALNYTFGRPSDAVTVPDDTYDWIMAHLYEWACVLPLGTRTLEHDTVFWAHAGEAVRIVPKKKATR